MGGMALLPEEFGLEPSYPNPAEEAATFRFGLPEAAIVTITVFDLLGREVARAVEGHLQAGFHYVRVNTRELAAGTYVYRM